MDSEKQPILAKADIQEATVTVEKSKFLWIHLMIVPISFLTMLGSSIFTYVTDEWTQTEIKKKYFSDISLNSNISVCNIINKTDPDYVLYKSVQQKTADWLMYYKFGNYIPSLLTSLIFPAYSDSYGRRNIIILSIVGMCIKLCGTAIVIWFKQELYFIVIMFTCQGIAGGSSTMTATMFSYVADITHGEKQRVQGIVLMDFLIIGSTLAASVLSGVLVQTLGLGFANTAIICSGLVILSLICCCAFLPETLPMSKRLPAKSVLNTLKQTVAFYWSREFKGKRHCYIVLLTVLMFNELCSVNHTQMEILYLLGQPFCWGPAFIGYFSLARHASLTILGLIALKVMQKCMSSVAIAALSCLSSVGAYIIEAFARTDATIYCVAVAGMLTVLIFPMIRSLMSNLTSPELQGSMFASVGAIQVVGSLLAVPENEIYAATLSIMDGFVFLVLALFGMVAFIFLLLYCFIQPQQTVSGKPVQTTTKTKTAVDKF